MKAIVLTPGTYEIKYRIRRPLVIAGEVQLVGNVLAYNSITGVQTDKYGPAKLKIDGMLVTQSCVYVSSFEVLGDCYTRLHVLADNYIYVHGTFLTARTPFVESGTFKCDPRKLLLDERGKGFYNYTDQHPDLDWGFSYHTCPWNKWGKRMSQRLSPELHERYRKVRAASAGKRAENPTFWMPGDHKPDYEKW